MLVSLKSSIHADILSLVQLFNADFHKVSGRVLHIKNKIGYFAATFNELVDAQNNREDDIEWIKSELAYLEDHSRRNHVKICGLPKLVQNQKLNAYFTKIMAAAHPDSPIED